MTTNFLMLIYLIFSFILVFLILMDKGKGAEIGATFNDSTNEFFGNYGSASILNKIIIIVALVLLFINILINTTSNNEQIKQDHFIDIDKYQHMNYYKKL